jgi:dihydroorotase
MHLRMALPLPMQSRRSKPSDAGTFFVEQTNRREVPAMSDATLIRNARVMDPANGRDSIADLGIVNGRIADPAALRNRALVEIDASGLVAVPGLIDLHVHFREPGDPQAETVASGSRAAARGGFTTVVAMPNTAPPIDTAERVREQQALARAAGLVRVLSSGCLTRERQGRVLADMADMAAAGAAAFTDDGAVVPDRALMKKAMRHAAALRLPVMDHALDPELAGNGVMHDGEAACRLKLPGIPSAAETAMVERDIALCRETGCAIHIQHVSAAASVDRIREARRLGLPVSGEATPHHLLLCDTDIPGDDANFKMNPPLRTAEDREALLNAVADGALQAFATDHAPHTAVAKSQGMRDAPFGVIGLETAVPVTYTACVLSGRMSLMEWIRRWTTGPAAILRMPPPSLAPGQPADLTLLSLDMPFTVGKSRFASRSSNCPFLGMTLTGRAVKTFFSGFDKTPFMKQAAPHENTVSRLARQERKTPDGKPGISNP